MRSYNCMTCQEPLRITYMLEAYIRQHGPIKQKCMKCGAQHAVTSTSVTLAEPGVLMARLSQEYEYPEHVPYRVGQYRVRFASGEWARAYWHWDGENFINGPVRLSRGSIVTWQGLAGDMEHLKKMPYDMPDAIVGRGADDE